MPSVDANALEQTEETSNRYGYDSEFCEKCGAWKGQLGLEPTFDLYVEHLCQIFDEIRRILKPTGTCWVNIGDTYNSKQAGNIIPNGIQQRSREERDAKQKFKRSMAPIPEKCLCQIPERFSIAMVDRGWTLRNSIVWHKPNAMPQSMIDRFTMDHEMIYLFVKSSKNQYWVNSKIGKISTKKPKGINGEEGVDWEMAHIGNRDVKLSLWFGHDYFFEQQFQPISEATVSRRNYGRYVNSDKCKDGEYAVRNKEYGQRMVRNMRTVWSISTKSFPEAHFAVYPEDLVETPIKAGCPEFVCKKCGAPIIKITDDETGEFVRYAQCDCNEGFEKGIVLDPFFGSGTTGVAAIGLNRDFSGIDTNTEYIQIAEARISEKRKAVKLDRMIKNSSLIID